MQDALLELLIDLVELPIVHVSVHPVEHDGLSDLDVDVVCKQRHYLVARSLHSFIFHIHLNGVHSLTLIAYSVEFAGWVLTTRSDATEFTLGEELTLELVVL